MFTAVKSVPFLTELLRKSINLVNLADNNGTAWEGKIALAACFPQINLRYSLTRGCATGLESYKRPIFLKMALSLPSDESTEPAAKREGQFSTNTWTQLSMNYSSARLIPAYQELNNIVRSTGRNALRRGQGN